MTQTYYGIIKSGSRYAEVLVTRRNGRQVSQAETGITYKTWREACDDNERKNAKLWAR